MVGKHTPEKLISAEEAVRIADEASTVTEISRGLEITREWIKQKGSITQTYDIYFMLSAVYVAGRIQGIREERLKNKMSCHN